MKLRYLIAISPVSTHLSSTIVLLVLVLLVLSACIFIQKKGTYYFRSPLSFSQSAKALVSINILSLNT